MIEEVGYRALNFSSNLTSISFSVLNLLIMIVFLLFNDDDISFKLLYFGIYNLLPASSSTSSSFLSLIWICNVENSQSSKDPNPVLHGADQVEQSHVS